jgi:hypothetical protein
MSLNCVTMARFQPVGKGSVEIVPLLLRFRLLSDAQPQEWHTATVTGFICPKCNAGFRRMWDLIRHKCGQTLRYACPYCHKKDNSSSNVYRHIRRWHVNQPIRVNKMFWMMRIVLRAVENIFLRILTSSRRSMRFLQIHVLRINSESPQSRT